MSYQYIERKCKIDDIMDVIHITEQFIDFGYWPIPPLEQLDEAFNNAVSPDTEIVHIKLAYVEIPTYV
jgi:hypothetical protein